MREVRKVEDRQLKAYDIHTAYYKTNTIRQFQPAVSWNPTNHLSKGTVFPNLGYGFNMRNFTVITLEVTFFCTCMLYLLKDLINKYSIC